MGLDSMYDYGINSPLNYSSEEKAETCYFAGPRVSLWSSEPEPNVESDAFPTFASETQLNHIKDQQNLADQRLVHLEELVMELGEKLETELCVKKPLVHLGTKMVVFIGISMCVLVMGMILISK